MSIFIYIFKLVCHQPKDFWPCFPVWYSAGCLCAAYCCSTWLQLLLNFISLHVTHFCNNIRLSLQLVSVVHLLLFHPLFNCALGRSWADTFSRQITGICDSFCLFLWADLGIYEFSVFCSIKMLPVHSPLQQTLLWNDLRRADHLICNFNNIRKNQHKRVLNFILTLAKQECPLIFFFFPPCSCSLF